MGGKRIGEACKERILARIKQGIPLREVARENGVSLDTVRRIAKAHGGEMPESLAERLAKRQASDAPEQSGPPEYDPADPEGSTQRLFSWLLGEGARLAAIGNPRGAAQINTAVKTFAPILDRQRRGREEDASVLRISRREIEEAEANMLERIAAILDRPLLCAECSRKLSVEWGEGRRNAPGVTGDAEGATPGVTPGRRGGGTPG